MKNPIQAISDAMLTGTVTRPVEDPFRFLKEHHRKIDDLLSQIAETTEQATSTREQLFTNINEELTLHAEIEESLIYPKFREKKEMQKMTAQAYEEHDIMKNLLTDLEISPYDTEEWTGKLNALIENVRHHVEEEESQVFPEAESAFSEEEQETMGREIENFLAERET